MCHGPAVFVQGPKNPEGKPLVSGKKVTGFSNSEEGAVGKTKLVPWLLEVRLALHEERRMPLGNFPMSKSTFAPASSLVVCFCGTGQA